MLELGHKALRLYWAFAYCSPWCHASSHQRQYTDNVSQVNGWATVEYISDNRII